MSFRLFLVVFLLVLPVVMGASRARGDEATLTISDGNSALSGYTGPYATVTINLTNSTTATVAFDSLANGGYDYLMTDGGSADLNVLLTGTETYTLSAVNETNSVSGFTLTVSSTQNGTSSSQIDHQGQFNLVIDNGSADFAHSASQITFTLTLNGGTWSSAADVLAPNNDHNFAAVHVGACTTPCTTGESFTTTGFAGDSSAPVLTPEPLTAALFGSGLLLLAGVLRRRVLA